MNQFNGQDPKIQKQTTDKTVVYSPTDFTEAKEQLEIEKRAKEERAKAQSFVAASAAFDSSRSKQSSAQASPWGNDSFSPGSKPSPSDPFQVPDFLSGGKDIPEDKVKMQGNVISVPISYIDDSDDSSSSTLNKADSAMEDSSYDSAESPDEEKASGILSRLGGSAKTPSKGSSGNKGKHRWAPLIQKVDPEELEREFQLEEEQRELKKHAKEENRSSKADDESNGHSEAYYASIDPESPEFDEIAAHEAAYAVITGESDSFIPPFYSTDEEKAAAEKERKATYVAAAAAPSRLARKGKKHASAGSKSAVGSSAAGASSGNAPGLKSGKLSGNGTGKKKEEKKKKKRHPFLMLFAALFALFLVGCSAAFIFVYSIVSKAEPIEPSEFHSLLAETSVIYDGNGKEIDEIYYGGNRETVSVDKMPDNLKNAFIALEDKTFRTHNGFNFIRIVGAIRDALTSGGEISGTSTITQQLARNLWIKDEQYSHSYRRKLIEAYYAAQIEKELTKDEILEAYLNTIYFGYNSYGVQTAARNYFSKDVGELTIAECATLAALPQAPDSYQLVQFVEGGNAQTYSSTLLKETKDGVFVANDISKSRRDVCLDLMCAQGYITEQERDSAKTVSLVSMLKPDFTSLEKTNSYFVDYVVSEVIQDLMTEKGYDYNKAWTTAYQGGLEIYSTLDPQAQEIVEQEFANYDNYPAASPFFDGNSNIINSDGNVLMLSYDNYFDENGVFYLPEGVMERRADGSAILHYSDHLNIYQTEVQGATDYSIEFKDLYYYDDDWFLFSIAGGFINIPQSFKSSAGDDGIIISKDFLQSEEYKNFITFMEDGRVSIQPGLYTLNTRTRQPQAAMTIVENSTGHIKAMIGGRDTSGRMLFNRATATHQPGSSIKPLAVYSAAIQQSAEEYARGEKHSFVNYHIDKQGADLWGDYLTAASVVLDERTTIDGEAWPKNFSRSYTGFNTMRSAIVSSINTCAVKIVMQVGYEYALETVKKFGITSLVEEGSYNDLNPAALGLGGLTYGVSTLEMASAYTVFPNNGVRYPHSSYTKVLDNEGNILLENKPEPVQVLDPGVAWIMSDMLRDVVLKSSGAADIEGVFVGGKTGTATGEGDAYCDIWFDGFTQNYTASLWIGNDKIIPLSDYSSAATAFWGRVMRQIDGSYLGERAPMPENVIYTNGEYFIQGTETGIKGKSSIVKDVTICDKTGLIATSFCEETTTEEFLNYGDDSDRAPTSKCKACEEEEKERLEEEKKKEEEEKKKKEEEEKKKKEEEEKAKKEAEKKAQEEAEKKAQEEAEKKAQEEAARKAAEEEAARKAKEEAEQKAREEAEQKAREEAEKQAAEEAARQAEEAAKQAAEEEARKAAEEEAARQAAEEEARRKAEEQAAAEEAARQAEQEAIQEAEEAANGGGESGGEGGGE